MSVRTTPLAPPSRLLRTPFPAEGPCRARKISTYRGRGGPVTWRQRGVSWEAGRGAAGEPAQPAGAPKPVRVFSCSVTVSPRRRGPSPGGLRDVRSSTHSWSSWAPEVWETGGAER